MKKVDFHTKKSYYKYFIQDATVTNCLRWKEVSYHEYRAQWKKDKYSVCKSRQ